ncbi:HEPN domain-containing protein [Candidatus Woesearchaeota archaeon]|nr:HEPN domain-containing protein [Candidatus Woesearchaeota archaeon]
MRSKQPDAKQALSLVISAEKDIKFTLNIEVSEASTNTIVRNTYESFRMLGEAMLIKKGIKSQDHVSMIKEITTLNIQTERPLMIIERLRKLRHNINYYGYRATIQDAEDAISLAKSCFEPALKEIKRILKG